MFLATLVRSCCWSSILNLFLVTLEWLLQNHEQEFERELILSYWLNHHLDIIRSLHSCLSWDRLEQRFISKGNILQKPLKLYIYFACKKIFIQMWVRLILSNEMEHSDSKHNFKIFIVNFKSEIVINLRIYFLVGEYVI